MDLQFLPYIVVTNPHIKKVYDSYQHAFETLHNLPKVKTVEQNAEFTVLLKRLVDEHGQSPVLYRFRVCLLTMPADHGRCSLSVSCAPQMSTCRPWSVHFVPQSVLN